MKWLFSKNFFNTGSSNPKAVRPPFQPGLKEAVLKRSGLYDTMHRLHFIRLEETRAFLRILRPGGSLLDIACGDGFFTRTIAEQLGCQAIGIDLMKARIDRARFYNLTNSCRFEVADAA